MGDPGQPVSSVTLLADFLIGAHNELYTNSFFGNICGPVQVFSFGFCDNEWWSRCPNQGEVIRGQELPNMTPYYHPSLAPPSQWQEIDDALPSSVLKSESQ